LNALAAAKKVIVENTEGAASQTYDSFVQTGMSTSAGLHQVEAARFMRDLARKEHSTQLAQLAIRMRSAARGGNDPFSKIKGMIQDMIEKLEKEGEEAAQKKAFCDKELAETNQKKADKTNKIAKLTASIGQMTSRSATLKEQVAELQKGLLALAKAQAAMDKIRAEEKAEYETNSAEMQQGLKGIKVALKVLNEYYGESDKAHSAAQGAGEGIIGMLEVVESDFTKGLAEMQATEEDAANTYEKQSQENEIEKSTKEQDVKYKNKESAQLDQDVSESSSDLNSEQEELDATLQYLSKIEGQCVEKAESFADRKARYEAEIAGCKEALRILETETAQSLLQRVSLRGVHRH